MSAFRNDPLMITIGYYASFFALGLCLAVIGPTLPGLAEQTNAPLFALGVIFTFREFGFILTALQGAKLYDRLPGHWIMGLSLCISSVILFLVPFFPWLWAILACFLILGALLGMVDVGGNAMLVWAYGKRVGPYMNGLHFFFGVGAFISPLIVAHVLRTQGDMQWTYRILALIIFPIGVMITRLHNHKPHNVSQEGSKETLDYGLIFFLALFLGLYVGAEVGYGGWISTYVVMQGLAAQAQAALFASAYWGAFSVGRLVSIPAAMRLAPLPILAITLAGALGSIGLLLIFPASVAGLWVATLGFGFFTGPIFATVVSLAGQLMKITGQTTGLIFLGASLGAMTMPWLIGQLFTSLGAIAMVYVIIVAVIIAFGVLGVIVGFRRRSIRLVEEEVSL